MQTNGTGHTHRAYPGQWATTEPSYQSNCEHTTIHNDCTGTPVNSHARFMTSCVIQYLARKRRLSGNVRFFAIEDWSHTLQMLTGFNYLLYVTFGVHDNACWITSVKLNFLLNISMLWINSLTYWFFLWIHCFRKAMFPLWFAFFCEFSSYLQYGIARQDKSYVYGFYAL